MYCCTALVTLHPLLSTGPRRLNSHSAKKHIKNDSFDFVLQQSRSNGKEPKGRAPPGLFPPPACCTLRKPTHLRDGPMTQCTQSQISLWCNRSARNCKPACACNGAAGMLPDEAISGARAAAATRHALKNVSHVSKNGYISIPTRTFADVHA